MKRLGLFALIALLAFASTGLANEGNLQPVKLNMASMYMGSSWYSYGSIFCEVLQKELPKGSQVNMLPQAGAAGNPKMVANKSADFGFGYNLSNFWAQKGLFIYDKPLDNLRGLVGNLDTFYYAAVMRKDGKITDLAEVAEKKLPIRISTVPKGGMGEVVTRLVLQYYGFTYDDVRSWGGKVEHTDFASIVDAFKDGQTDFFLQNITQGHAALTELAVTTDLQFVQFPKEMIDAFVKDYGFSVATLPANSFKGQGVPIESLSVTTNLFTNTDMPDSIAYLITKSVCENTEALHTGHVALKRFDPKDAAEPKGLGLPLHPGAERYYKEAGYMPSEAK